MKVQKLLIALGIALVSKLTLATPSLDLTSVNSSESVSLTLKVKNAIKIENVKFTGLDNFQVLGREVAINASSANESSNVFSNTLLLAPTTVESNEIYATAIVDGKKISSNKVHLDVTTKQLADFKRRAKEQALANKKNMEETQKHINEQLKAQQKYFNEMSKLMQKQQQQMQKAQQELFKQTDNSF